MNAFSKYLGVMKLFFRASGKGPPLIILHGLFGSSDNWFSVAKSFASNFTVYLVDQRNHGQSPHSEEFDYQLLAEDLHEFISSNDLRDAAVIGHSMGGKVAMNFAVKYPAQLSRLVVVDIVPKKYPIHHDRILDGLQALQLAQLKSRSDADTQLATYVPDSGERQFLLKNLERIPSGGFQWKMNLTSLDAHIGEISEGMVFPGSFPKPTLFVIGARSNYFRAGDEEVIHSTFPAAKIVRLDTGHWVQAERPAEFIEAVLKFLQS